MLREVDHESMRDLARKEGGLDFAKEFEALFHDLVEGRKSIDDVRAFRSGDPDNVTRQFFHIPKTIVRSEYEWKQFWRSICRRAFDLQVNFANLKLPEHVSNYDRLVIVPEGFSYAHWYTFMLRLFDVECNERVGRDLQAYFPYSDRDSSKTYAFWTHDDQEVDSHCRGKSAADCWEEDEGGKATCMNLKEYLLTSTAYFLENWRFMDSEYGTIVAGSWNEHDEVPILRWNKITRSVVIDKTLSALPVEQYGPREIITV